VTLFFVLLTLAVVGVVAAVALGRISGGMDEATSTVPVHPLPTGELTPSDLDGIRFAPALRGYRMDQVDAALDRLRVELARRDDELADLRGGRNEALVGATAGYAGGSGAKKRPKPSAAAPLPAEPEPAVVPEPAEAEPVARPPVAEPVAEPVAAEPVAAEPVADPSAAEPDDAPTAAQPVVTEAPDRPAGPKAADEA
jgi:DivIVA domain-containing protein